MNWTDFVSIISALVAIAAGIGGAPRLVQSLKSATGATGNAALALSIAVAVLFGVATAIVEGIVSPASLTPGNAGALITTVWAASQVQYLRIKSAGD